MLVIIITVCYIITTGNKRTQSKNHITGGKNYDKQLFIFRMQGHG